MWTLRRTCGAQLDRSYVWPLSDEHRSFEGQAAVPKEVRNWPN